MPSLPIVGREGHEQRSNTLFADGPLCRQAGKTVGREGGRQRQNVLRADEMVVTISSARRTFNLYPPPTMPTVLSADESAERTVGMAGANRQFHQFHHFGRFGLILTAHIDQKGLEQGAETSQSFFVYLFKTSGKFMAKSEKNFETCFENVRGTLCKGKF